MTTVYYNDQSVHTLPDNFEELTAKQLLAVAPFLLKGEVSEEEKAVVALLLLQTNEVFSVKASKEKNGYDYLADEMRTKLVPGLAWLFGKNLLTKNLFPEIKIGRIQLPWLNFTFYGPADNFDNITLEEYADSEFCLAEYARTSSELWLNRFLAVLYRPGSKSLLRSTGDARRPYNIHENDYLGRKLATLSDNQKCAILFWYYGCRNVLTEDYKFLFSKENAQKAEQGAGWVDVIHGMAGAKFGDIKQTGKTLLKVILTEMRHQYQQAQQ
jgi:hypothetical protein